MFSWICPQCGRDVPPTKTDCPYCAEQAALAAAGPPLGATQAQGSQQAAPWQQPGPGYGAPPAWPPPPAQYPPHPPAPQAAVQQPPVQPPPAPQPPAAYGPPQQYPPQQYPPQPPYTPPHANPAQQPYAPAPQHPHGAPSWTPAPASQAPPTWLVGLGFAAVLLLVGGGIYYFFLRTPDNGSASPAKTTTAASAAAASGQKVTSPYQKYVEVVGVRMVSEGKQPVAKFVVVNHSSTEIDNLEANVRLQASTSRSDEDAVGSFSFKLKELDPYSSKDLTEPLKTKMKMYELPDWQNTTAEIEITSPTQ